MAIYISYPIYPQSKKEGKDQESIQSSTTPDPNYQGESDNFTIDITKESQEVSPFPAGDPYRSDWIRSSPSPSYNQINMDILF